MNVERRYVLTKLSAGDYLLPSNDAQTVWRIARDEGEGWSLWRWDDEVSELLIDISDWSRWSLMESHIDSRKDAVGIALSMTQTDAQNQTEGAG